MKVFCLVCLNQISLDSSKKSISACVIAKSKLKKELQPEEARIICEKEIKK